MTPTAQIPLALSLTGLLSVGVPLSASHLPDLKFYTPTLSLPHPGGGKMRRKAVLEPLAKPGAAILRPMQKSPSNVAVQRALQKAAEAPRLDNFSGPSAVFDGAVRADANIVVPESGILNETVAPAIVRKRSLRSFVVSRLGGVVYVSNMEQALQALRAGSEELDPELRRAFDHLRSLAPELPLDPERVFLIKDPKLWKAILGDPDAAGMAILLRQIRFSGPIVDDVPIILISASRARSSSPFLPTDEPSPDPFVRILAHEAIHVKDHKVLDFPFSAPVAHWMIEGYTELRALKLPQRVCEELGFPYPPRMIAYPNEVSIVRRLIEAIGEAPLRELVERGSTAGLRRALGARWRYMEVLSWLHGISLRDRQVAQAVGEIAERPAFNFRSFLVIALSLGKSRYYMALIGLFMLVGGVGGALRPAPTFLMHVANFLLGASRTLWAEVEYFGGISAAVFGFSWLYNRLRFGKRG